MADSLPEALQAMLKHADETYASGDFAKAEKEFILALDYSREFYHESSATTGLVLLRLVGFYETTGQRSKAAVTMGRANAIVAGYKGINFY